MVRVRIAPSPTGIPHIGNTRTALFNYLFAKHNNGVFILRIEDTDRNRIVEGAKEAILEILNWLGLNPDESYVQSERIDEYKKHTQILLDKKLAYEKEGAVWMRIPDDHKPFFWQDGIGNKEISFKKDSLKDFVILKSDGYPTYHMANVVDDHLMNISHVIRGDEWISSTPKHILLYESFGWDMPVFCHLPVILGPDRTKLSKRHGAKSVLDYRNEGYLKEALINFMALLGWTPKGDREIFSMEEMIDIFDLKDVNTNSPIFNIDKLQWFNGGYIRNMTADALKSKIKAQKSDLQLKIQSLDDEMLNKLINLARTRIKTLNDFENLTRYFFEEPAADLNEKEKNIANIFFKKLSNLSRWDKETILSAIKEVISESKIKGNLLYKIITGNESGLPLPESLEIFGKEKTISLLKKIS